MPRLFNAQLAALGVASLTTLHACSSPPPSAQPPPSSPPPAFTAREELYLLRSIREPQAPRADFCTPERLGFEPFPADAERAFSFWSVEARPIDARVVQTQSARVAHLRGCFGPTAERVTQKFYAEIQLASATFHGQGECTAVNVDFPEPGLFPVHCFLVLRDLPAPYVGGLLTTNTLTSKSPYGGDTDPPGYSQASIATVRLWK